MTSAVGVHIESVHIESDHNKRGVWIGDGVGTVGKMVDHISIVNCHILANTWQGVVGSGGTDVDVLHNFFSGNGEGGTNTLDDIYMTAKCLRWNINNHHINSTGKTRYAVYYLMPAPGGVDSHPYHRIDGTFEKFSQPIAYQPYGDPTTTPINANTCFIQGTFEYWNTAGKPPSDTADNTNASVHTEKIPLGTICINNATSTGAERWLAVKGASSGGASLLPTFYRLS